MSCTVCALCALCCCRSACIAASCCCRSASCCSIVTAVTQTVSVYGTRARLQVHSLYPCINRSALRACGASRLAPLSAALCRCRRAAVSTRLAAVGPLLLLLALTPLAAHATAASSVRRPRRRPRTHGANRESSSPTGLTASDAEAQHPPRCFATSEAQQQPGCFATMQNGYGTFAAELNRTTERLIPERKRPRNIKTSHPISLHSS